MLRSPSRMMLSSRRSTPSRRAVVRRVAPGRSGQPAPSSCSNNSTRSTARETPSGRRTAHAADAGEPPTRGVWRAWRRRGRGAARSLGARRSGRSGRAGGRLRSAREVYHSRRRVVRRGPAAHESPRGDLRVGRGPLRTPPAAQERAGRRRATRNWAIASRSASRRGSSPACAAASARSSRILACSRKKRRW